MNGIAGRVLGTMLLALYCICALTGSAFAQSPINDYIAYSSKESGTWELWGLDPNTGINELLLTVGGGRIWGGSFSPDRTRFAYSSNSAGSYDIYILELDGSGTTVNVTDDSYTDFMPRWIDNDSLIFVQTESGGQPYKIMQVSLDDLSVKCLTCSLTGSSYTMFVESPCKARIAYTREDDLVYVADFPSFENECSLPNLPGPVDMATDWSNGVIAYYTTNTSNIYTTSDCIAGVPDTLNITVDNDPQATPLFSYDGLWIAYESWEGNISNIWIIAANGSDRKQLTTVSQANVIEILDWGGTFCDCAASCDCGLTGDVNCDGQVNPVDVVYLVNCVYKSQCDLCTKP